MMAVLSNLSNAIAAAVENRGTRGIAETLGVGKSSVARWGDDLAAWSALALLTLANEDAEVRAAVLDHLAGTEVKGRASNASRDGFGVMISGNKTLASVAKKLADGELSPAEARDVLPELHEHLAQVRRFILDAQAIANAAGCIGGHS